MEYTENQIRDYVCGWFTDGGDKDIASLKSALYNAFSMLEDGQDGIKAYVERRKDIPSKVEQNYEEPEVHSLIPLEARDCLFGALEDGAKVFLFEPCDDVRAFFVEHSHGDATILSWVVGSDDIHYFNIDKNTRNKLAKDLEVK